MLVPSRLRLEVAHGTERERAVLTDAHFDVHAFRRDPGGHAPAVDSDTDDSYADVGRHRHAPPPDAYSRARIDTDFADADPRARDPHADRSGSNGDARHAGTH
jgi:hypothetical protein